MDISWNTLQCSILLILMCGHLLTPTSSEATLSTPLIPPEPLCHETVSFDSLLCLFQGLRKIWLSLIFLWDNRRHRASFCFRPFLPQQVSWFFFFQTTIERSTPKRLIPLRVITESRVQVPIDTKYLNLTKGSRKNLPQNIHKEKRTGADLFPEILAIALFYLLFNLALILQA